MDPALEFRIGGSNVIDDRATFGDEAGDQQLANKSAIEVTTRRDTRTGGNLAVPRSRLASSTAVVRALCTLSSALNS
jgi:hypothetical protein